MINRTYAFAGVILGGLIGLGLYANHANQPAAAPKPGEPIVTLTLPDVDGDQKPDTLFVTYPENGQSQVMLTHTVNNRTGPMLPLAVDGPLKLEGKAPNWTLKDAAGQVRLSVSTFQNGPDMTPDLIVRSDANAKRYVWMQRGYLKLDAFTVTPGFAVGLAMVGDPKGALEAIAGAPDASGMWKQPIAEPLAVHVKFDEKGQVKDLTYDTPRYTCDFNLSPGQPLNDHAKQLPARYEQDKWIAPNYGLIGVLDDHKKLKTLTITQPWNERPESKPDPAKDSKQAPAKDPKPETKK